MGASPLWTARPSKLLIITSAGDIAVVTFLAVQRVLMAPVSLTLVLAVLAIAALFTLLDPLKVAIFQRFGVA